MFLILHSTEVTPKVGETNERVWVPLGISKSYWTPLQRLDFWEIALMCLFFLSFLFCRVFVKTSGFITCSFLHIVFMDIISMQ